MTVNDSFTLGEEDQEALHLVRDGVTYVPARVALALISLETGLTVGGAYRMLARARVEKKVRVVIVSSRHRWFAEQDLANLISSKKEQQ
jgi:hypothetical protein